MLNLSANISLLFTENSFLERFGKASENNFQAVEFQFPYEFSPEIIKEKLDKFNLDLSVFNSLPGNFKNGDRGLACLPKRKEEFQRTIIQSIEYAKIIKCKKIHIMSGIQGSKNDLAYRDTYIENLQWACDKFSEEDLTVLIEPINSRNIPDYFLSSTDMAIKIIELTAKKNIKLLFDIYHHQIIRGDVTKYLKNIYSYIGHIQIAGIPDRNEPDISEIDYKFIFKIINDLGYKGWIGCEYNPIQDTESGLSWREKINLI
ncbi:MAG: hydroxypyruvate isomerase [SAR116 cluster bacterium]|nr:hydroxypyruvate isomerase [SAR116 cluster bacterium]